MINPLGDSDAGMANPERKKVLKKSLRGLGR